MSDFIYKISRGVVQNRFRGLSHRSRNQGIQVAVYDSYNWKLVHVRIVETNACPRLSRCVRAFRIVHSDKLSMANRGWATNSIPTPISLCVSVCLCLSFCLICELTDICCLFLICFNWFGTCVVRPLC